MSPRRWATLSDVDSLAEAAAAKLAAHGLQGGQLVALTIANGPAFLAAFLALRRRGLVPLLMDASTPAGERERTASELGASAMLTAPAWAETAAEIEVTGLAPAVARRLPADTGAVKLTSGSTGRPRGIVTPTAALVADDAQLVASMGLDEHDRLLAMVPLSHSYGFSSLALPALLRGWPLVVAEERGPFAPLDAAAACGATFLPAVPAWLSALVRLAEPPAWPASIRLVISAGAPLPSETAARFRALYGQPVHVFYGASECGGICYDRDGGAAERGTVGTAVDAVRLRLADDGQVSVCSAAVAAGTIPDHDPRFAAGVFTTSDLGTCDGGELRLRGRVDDLVIVKGKNVNPREVESVLRQLPGVEDVAVLGVPRPGSQEPTLRAVIACRSGAVTYEAAVAWCRSRLAEHKVPRNVAFVEALPRTERGKLDRQALRDL